ncbi:MAG: patatin-like phospholipase family protein [Balneolaceae bacterium]
MADHCPEILSSHRFELHDHSLFSRLAKTGALLILATTLLPLLLTAQDRSDENSEPRIGLALSGGGAKGIAHIGVLKVLEEAGIRPDYITGTSMGSLVGALYSIGYTPDEMEMLARTTDWEEIFSDRSDRRQLSMYERDVDERYIVNLPVRETGIDLPAGLISGQSIFLWIARHTWQVHEVEDFNRFPIPFAAIATDLETGEAVVMRDGFLPDAIRASISLPTVMLPHVVNGRVLMDGGLVRNLPVEDARNMGADIVIAVDVSTPLRSAEELQSIFTILTQAMNYRMSNSTIRQKALADLAITVDDLDDFLISDFMEADRFIEYGEKAARLKLNELKEIASLQRPGIIVEDEPERSRRILLNEVQIEGNNLIPADYIRTELALELGDRIDLEDIESAIKRLYSTRLFNLITYRVTENTDSEGVSLLFRIDENRDDQVRIAARYESPTQASIKMHTSLRNIGLRGSTFRTGLRIGRDARFSTEYLWFGNSRSSYGLRGRLVYEGESVNHYSGNERTSSLRHHLGRAELFSGTFMSNQSLAGVGIRYEIQRFTQEINPQDIPFTNRDHYALYALFYTDSRNRRSWTTRGQLLYMNAVLSDDRILSTLKYNLQEFYWSSWYPLSESVTLNNSIYAGRSSTGELPWGYWFSPNRSREYVDTIRFGGYERYEIAGSNIQLVSASIQLEPIRHRFLRLSGYAGNTFERWNWNPFEQNYRLGFSLSFGAQTVVGPLQAIISTSSSNRLLFELQLGYEF